MSGQATIAQTTEQAVARAALIKLLFFAAALAILPITSYFVSSKYIWTGNVVYAAVTAVCVANIVLIAYIVLSVLEDRQSLKEAEEKKLSEPKKYR
ncbi:hypothetical protein ID866_3561 [Astraeus odoratus]|nr:hypothetical protein ID866_3561 [Astraeus odoratus]